MWQLLTALDSIHSHGIMHRDIKGDNIMIDRDGYLRLIDFDLAEYLHPLTVGRLGHRVATVGYMAPEVFLK